MKKNFLKKQKLSLIIFILAFSIPASAFAATEKSFFENLYCKTLGSWIDDIFCKPLLFEILPDETAGTKEPALKIEQKLPAAVSIPAPTFISDIDTQEPTIIPSLAVSSGVSYIPAAFDVSSFVTKEFLTRQLDTIFDSIDRASISDLSAFDTSDLAEGSNLYFTDARVGSYISASTTIPHTAGSAYGDLLFWNGANWNTIATSSLGISASSQWTTSGSDIYFNTGNIGIGTTSPYAKLSVTGNAAINGDLLTTGTTTSNGFVLNSAKTFYVGNEVLIDALGTLTATVLPLQDTASNLSGIVPLSGELVYETDTKLARIGDGITNVSSLFPLNLWSLTGGDTQSIREAIAPYFTATSTSIKSTFPYASSTALSVSGKGYFGSIGIGIDTAFYHILPETILHIRGTSPVLTIEGETDDFEKISFVSDATERFYISNDAGAGETKFFNIESESIIWGVSDAEIMRIDYLGNFGIGTSTPWKAFSVGGAAAFGGLTGATGAGSICLSAKKELVYNSGSDACLPSLKSTKKDIEDLSVNALSLVEDLQPATFVYKEGDQRVRYGFIAEDTEEIDEHLVTYNAEGDLSGIDDRAMTSLLVKAVKELKVKIDLFQVSSSSPALSNEGIWDFITEKFSQAVISIKDLVSETVTAAVGSFGKVSVSEGIEIKDSETGDIYCLTIKNGETHTEEGECGESDDDSGNDNSDNDNNNDNSNDNDDEEIVDDDQATTTPETSGDEKIEEPLGGDESDDVVQGESPDPEPESEPSPEETPSKPEN